MHLWNWGLWGDVAWIALVLIPAVFGLVLALPLRLALLPVGAAFAVLAVLTYADVNVFANFARLGAATLIRLVVPRLLRDPSWVVLVAAIIPWGSTPTRSGVARRKRIVENHEHVFSARGSGARRALRGEPRDPRPALPSSRRRTGFGLRLTDLGRVVVALGWGRSPPTVWSS